MYQNVTSKQTENFMTNKEWWKNYYAEMNLTVGLTIILCAFYFIAPTLFTFKNSLITIDGKLQKVETYYEKINNTGKLGHKFTSNKSELIIYLKGNDQMYSLMKNIGYESRNEQYENIKKALNNSKSVKIWINKNQIDEWKPQVFQIEMDNDLMLYDIMDAKSELLFLFPFMIILGAFSTGIYLRHKYPIRFKKIIGI